MSAIPPDELTERFLRSLRHQFYKGRDKLYFQERNLLLQAICWPARYLDERAVRISAERYQSILTTVIRTINTHGNLAQVRSLGRYLLHAVQEHMRHHGEDYYEIGKATRNALDDVMRGLRPQERLGREAAAIHSGDSTVPVLAETLRVLAASKGGRKPGLSKTIATPMQGDLFGRKTATYPTARDSKRALKSSQTFDQTGVLAPKVLKSGRGDSSRA
jgi:hypothetical protein